MTNERQARLPEDPSDYTMSLGDHLEELRRRVIAAVIVPLPLSILIFFIAHILVEWLLLPLQKVQLAWGFPPEVQVLSPPEFLLLELKLSVVLALVSGGTGVVLRVVLDVAPERVPALAVVAVVVGQALLLAYRVAPLVRDAVLLA